MDNLTRLKVREDLTVLCRKLNNRELERSIKYMDDKRLKKAYLDQLCRYNSKIKYKNICRKIQLNDTITNEK